MACLLLVTLLLLYLPPPAYAYIEVPVKELNHTLVYPLERSYRFVIPVKNAGSEVVHVHPEVTGVPKDWICVGGGDLLLQPGEEGKTVFVFTILPSTQTRQANVAVTLYDVKEPSHRAVVTLSVGFMFVNPPRDAFISGRVLDSSTGEPIAGVKVKALYWSALDCCEAYTDTDGRFTLNVPSAEALDELYEAYSLRGSPALSIEFHAEGYEYCSLNDVRASRDEALNLEVCLTPIKAKRSYGLAWKQPVEGYGIWKCVPSQDWSLIAVCQGEHGFKGLTTPPDETHIYVFDVNGTLLWKQAIERESWAVDVSPDGSKIASGSHAGKAYVWSREGELLWSVDASPHGPIREVRFSHSGRFLALGPTPEGRGYVGLYDADTGRLLWSYETGDHVRELEFSHDDQYLAVASTDGYLYLFTINGTLLWKRFNGGYVPFILFISEDGDMIVVGGKGEELRAYDLQGNLLWSFEAPEIIQYGAATPDLSRIAVFAQGVLYMLNRHGEVVWQRMVGPIGHNAIAITSDGKYIALGGMDALYLLNENGTVIWSFTDFEKGGPPYQHPFLCTAQNVQLSSDASMILAGFGETDRHLRLFTLKLHIQAQAADLNHDGSIDMDDLAIIRSSYGARVNESNFMEEADLNDDGAVNIVDLAIFASFLP